MRFQTNRDGGGAGRAYDLNDIEMEDLGYRFGRDYMRLGEELPGPVHPMFQKGYDRAVGEKQCS